jgi:hypothetical protein
MIMLWRRRAAAATLRDVTRRMRFMVVYEECLWYVHEVGSGQPMGAFEGQQNAVRTARHLVEITGAELLVMNADGTLASRENGAAQKTA